MTYNGNAHRQVRCEKGTLERALRGAVRARGRQAVEAMLSAWLSDVDGLAVRVFHQWSAARAYGLADLPTASRHSTEFRVLLSAMLGPEADAGSLDEPGRFEHTLGYGCPRTRTEMLARLHEISAQLRRARVWLRTR